MKKLIEGIVGFGFEALVCIVMSLVGVLVAIFLGANESISIYSGIVVLIAMGATFAWVHFAKSGETAINVVFALGILASAFIILRIVFAVVKGG